VELASEVADDPAAIPALFGIHRGLTTRAELDRARALAERVMDGAQRSHDSQALLAGHYFLGQTLFLQGELVAAREHLEEAVRLAAAMPDAAWLPGYPLDLGAAGFLEFTLVLLGLHDQAARVAEAANERLERSHPYSRALVISAGVFAAVYRRDPPLLRARAAAAAALTEQWGFRMLAVAAAAPLGWAQAIEGDPTGGAKMLREALAGWEAVGLRTLRAQLLGLLAEAEQLAGRPDQALRLLDDALALVDRGGERYCEAELHRLKGESLAAMSPPRTAEAEAAFTTSIAVARRQGAKLLEDRAAADLSRLRAARRPQSAR
jgi:tetratricopeptide (TPR) repeat protein